MKYYFLFLKVACTGEFFSGPTALAVVEGMKMNPFQSHLTPHKFMEQTLAIIGDKSFSLPEDPETAALTFLQKLTALGFAEFATIKHFKMVMDSSENSRKGLFR